MGLGARVEGALRFLVDGATGAATSAGFGTMSASVSFAGIAGAAVSVSRLADNAAFGCCFARTMVMVDEGRVGLGWVGVGRKQNIQFMVHGTTFCQKQEHVRLRGLVLALFFHSRRQVKKYNEYIYMRCLFAYFPARDGLLVHPSCSQSISPY